MKRLYYLALILVIFSPFFGCKDDESSENAPASQSSSCSFNAETGTPALDTSFLPTSTDTAEAITYFFTFQGNTDTVSTTSFVESDFAGERSFNFFGFINGKQVNFDVILPYDSSDAVSAFRIGKHEVIDNETNLNPSGNSFTTGTCPGNLRFYYYPAQLSDAYISQRSSDLSSSYNHIMKVEHTASTADDTYWMAAGQFNCTMKYDGDSTLSNEQVMGEYIFRFSTSRN